jgi:hypothetical protein
MTAEGPGFRRYRRPEFRLMSPLNITLLAPSCRALYEMESRRLEARGSVVVEDESGKHSAVSMTYGIENGRAVPIQ